MLTYLSGPVYVAYSTKTLITSVITLQWNPLSSNQNQFHEGALLDQNHIKSCLLVRANHPTLEKGIFREQAGFKKKQSVTETSPHQYKYKICTLEQNRWKDSLEPRCASGYTWFWFYQDTESCRTAQIVCELAGCLSKANEKINTIVITDCNRKGLNLGMHVSKSM